VTIALERRLEALEASTGGDGGCERCSGTLVVVSNVITGEFHSATWNGESITEEEASEHHTERKCPRCGRRLGERARQGARAGGFGDTRGFFEHCEYGTPIQSLRRTL
jgi:hypothetical protein